MWSNHYGQVAGFPVVKSQAEFKKRNKTPVLFKEELNLGQYTHIYTFWGKIWSYWIHTVKLGTNKVILEYIISNGAGPRPTKVNQYIIMDFYQHSYE